jgi:phenylalanine ammonia-lyase
MTIVVSAAPPSIHPCSDDADVVELTGNTLTVNEVTRVAHDQAGVRLTESPAVRERVDQAVELIQRFVEAGRPIYGVTTGFGGMGHLPVDPADAVALQHGLLQFLRAGAGSPLAERDVRGAMLIRANSNLRGASGLRWEIIERFVAFLNEGITPIVLEHGSIGASGDLVPLAAIAGAIVGKDGARVVWRGREMTATKALREIGLEPIELLPKEGLALVNGTSVSAAIASNCVVEYETLVDGAIGFHALVHQALAGKQEAFDPFIHAEKPHRGQVDVAATMLAMLHGSHLARPLEAIADHDNGSELIQDRYSLRCAAQFLGPIVEAANAARPRLEIEINSTSDNPLVDVDRQRICHGGNFLAQHVSTTLDALRAQLALLSKHVDVQIALLMAPEFSRGLPASLVGNPDRVTNMGLKGAQICGNSLMPLVTYHAAPLAQLFPTHAEQFNQNINSMAYGSAYLTRQQLKLATSHLAVALLCAVQAVELRTHLARGSYDARTALSPKTAVLYEAVKAALGSMIDQRRPTVYDDDDQDIAVCIERVTAELEVGGGVARALRAASDD